MNGDTLKQDKHLKYLSNLLTANGTSKKEVLSRKLAVLTVLGRFSNLEDQRIQSDNEIEAVLNIHPLNIHVWV